MSYVTVDPFSARVTIDVKSGPVPDKYTGNDLNEALDTFKDAIYEKRETNKLNYNTKMRQAHHLNTHRMTTMRNLARTRGDKAVLKTMMPYTGKNTQNYVNLKAKTAVAKNTLGAINEEGWQLEKNIQQRLDNRKKSCGWKKGWFGSWTPPSETHPGCEDIKAGGKRTRRRHSRKTRK